LTLQGIIAEKKNIYSYISLT